MLNFNQVLSYKAVVTFLKSNSNTDLDFNVGTKGILELTQFLGYSS